MVRQFRPCWEIDHKVAPEAPPKEQENHSDQHQDQLSKPLAPPSAEAGDGSETGALRGERGTASTGPGGLLEALTKTVIETALDEEMADHLGYDKRDPVGRGSQTSRNRHPHQDDAHRQLRAGGD